MFTIDGTEFGNKTIAETAVTGWSLTNIDCTGGTETDAGTGITVTVDPGDTIICTFTNKKDATLTVVKDQTPRRPGLRLQRHRRGHRRRLQPR